MNRLVTAIDVVLPQHWHWMPSHTEVSEGWCEAMARRLMSDGSGEEPDIEAVVHQLGHIFEHVTNPECPGIRAAVWAPPSPYAEIAGLICLRPTQVMGLDDFVALLHDWFAEEGDVMHNMVSVESAVPVGRVAGSRFIMKHQQVDDLGQPGESFEERLVLAVQPPDCDNLVEVMGIASSLGTFKEMTVYYLTMLQALSVRMGG